MSGPCCGEDTIDGESADVGLGPWVVVGEIDFSLDGVSIDLTNGTHVLNDGRRYTAQGRASATIFRVGPAGLEFTAAAVSGQWNTAPAQNAAALWITVNDDDPAHGFGVDERFIPDYDPARQYIYQAIVSSNNADAATEGVYLNLWQPAGNQYAGSSLHIGGGWHGSNATVLATGGVGMTSNTATPVLVPRTVGSVWEDMDTIGIETCPGQPSALMALAGVSPAAGEYPAMSDLRECGYIATTATPAALTAARYIDKMNRICLAFCTSNTTGTLSTIVRGLRALAREPN